MEIRRPQTVVDADVVAFELIEVAVRAVAVGWPRSVRRCIDDVDSDFSVGLSDQVEDERVPDVARPVSVMSRLHRAGLSRSGRLRSSGAAQQQDYDNGRGTNQEQFDHENILPVSMYSLVSSAQYTAQPRACGTVVGSSAGSMQT